MQNKAYDDKFNVAAMCSSLVHPGSSEVSAKPAPRRPKKLVAFEIKNRSTSDLYRLNATMTFR